MFLLRLARIALAAEELRLRYLIRRALIRVTLAAVAVLMFLCALIFAHLAGWGLLRGSFPAWQVAFMFFGGDVVGGAILLALALRSSPGMVERDALAVRERALDEAAESLTVTAMVVRLLDLLIPTHPRE